LRRVEIIGASYRKNPEFVCPTKGEELAIDVFVSSGRTLRGDRETHALKPGWLEGANSQILWCKGVMFLIDG
jgi:hypothetical protein